MKTRRAHNRRALPAALRGFSRLLPFICAAVCTGPACAADLTSRPPPATGSVEIAGDARPGSPHWAFQPVKRPPVPGLAEPAAGGPGSAQSATALAVPAAADGGQANRNPIDAFIRARLAERRLTLSPEADRVTLIRRLYLMMLGLPPQPEEVAAFVEDRRPAAFERLVDRVLEDPRYGERWARHWLDVIRFAESNGFETNRERPNAWPFRDYVIAAFNGDTPYNQFVHEQLAGDILGQAVATGFLVGGPVDIVGSPDPVLTAQQRADELDDMVSTTGTAFLGLTLGCARCHAHKFDPVSQAEYYALAAIFSGVRHGEHPLPLTAEQQQRVAALDATLQELETKLAPFRASPALPAAGNGTGPARRPPVRAAGNEELFAPTLALRLRFTVIEASSAEPCIDELEAWSGTTNVALAAHGTRAAASGTLPGYAIHKLEHINDGQVGNSHSWIASEPGRGWVELTFPRAERIDRVVWGRDREGIFTDRVPTQYRIEVATEADAWRLVASSDDREPFPGRIDRPAGPLYRFDSVPAAQADQGRQWLARLEQARRERAALTNRPRVYAGTFASPDPTHRLHRGDPMQPREAVAPGTPALFRPLTLATNAPEAQRRLALADWIADPANPLTARVWINRVWQHHFGIGLVDTPNDFGRNGSRPTHPELLDWLACELVARGGSLKALQRQILTSATWRQSSAPRPEAREADPGNRLLWRFSPRRLEAEAIRDTILAVSGNLDPAAGGPGFLLHEVERENVYHYHPKEVFGPDTCRRMIYAFKVRMEQDSVFGAFDCPDGSLAMGRRSVSTTPLQALNLFNSGFMRQQADRFAQRIEREGGPDAPGQVARAWQLAFNRPPTPAEAADATALAAQHGLPALGRALLNANELLFIP
jgi:hypothetical protein